MRRRRRRYSRKEVDDAMMDFALIHPPHPAEGIDTACALRKAIIHGYATKITLKESPHLVNLTQAVEKHLKWGIFFDARFPDDRRGRELAMRAARVLDHLTLLKLVQEGRVN
jgi:hypothetical protein